MKKALKGLLQFFSWVIVGWSFFMIETSYQERFEVVLLSRMIIFSVIYLSSLIKEART